MLRPKKPEYVLTDPKTGKPIKDDSGKMLSFDSWQKAYIKRQDLKQSRLEIELK